MSRVPVPWLAFGGLVLYEVVTMRRGRGPLTDFVRAAYGPPGSAQWWLVGSAGTGLLSWAIPHFLNDRYNGRQFRWHMTTALGVGVAGAIRARRRA